MKIALLVIAVMLLLIFTTKGFGMLRIYLFSPVKGVVVENGKPVAGAVIERSWDWEEIKGSDTTTTNHNGEFSLPAVQRTSLQAINFLNEPVTRQEINIKHVGKVYEAWLATKRNYQINGELNGKPIDLYCELSAEAKRREGGLRGYYGIGVIR